MRIVLLVGASTVGKSSLCAELKKKYEWKILSFDEVARRVRKPDYIERFEDLSSLMTDGEIYELCHSKSLTISNGENCISTYQFVDESLPELEELLKQSGFDEYQVAMRSAQMRSIVSAYVPYDQIMDEFFSTVFKQFDDDSSVVLDVIPNQCGDARALLEQFTKYCDNYRHSHPDLIAFSTLVYCPPATLSERIKKRNEDAILKNTPQEQRKGLFPFLQFARLIKINNPDSKHELGKFSKEELQDIFISHSPIESKNVDSKIDNPLGATPVQSESRTSKVKIKSRDYKNLKEKFGFFKHQQEGVLSIPETLNFDLIMNTETEAPSALTEKLLAQISVGSYSASLG